MSIAVVTPWWNHHELEDDYFNAVQDADEVVVVDNGSDPALDFALIRLEENRGFSFASNKGLAEASSDVVCFLNNDIKGGRPGWLKMLADAVGPKRLAGAQLRFDRHADVDGEQFPYLDGWCLAGLREDLLELGGFDETLKEPAYYSDNLLCLEARARGFELVEVPTGLTHLLNVTAAGMKISAATVANRARYEDRARELMRVAA